MKIARAWFIVCLLLTSMVIGFLPGAKANNQDSYGYTYRDSNTGGPLYAWDDISSTGTKVSLDYWHQEASNIPIGFEFNFYGELYDQILITCLGLLTFQQPSEYGLTYLFLQNSITHTPEIHEFIAPFWDPYFVAENAPFVYYQTKGVAPNRVFVVEWCNNTQDNRGLAFEAMLFENSGNVEFQYKDVDFNQNFMANSNNGAMATVGIEDQSGVVGLEYSYNQPVIANRLAILFSSPSSILYSNLFVSLDAPLTVENGQTMTSTLSFCNLGSVSASNVVLHAHIPSEGIVNFISASDNGIYDSTTGSITWNLGSINAYPGGEGTRTVTVQISSETQLGTIIQTSADISTSDPETELDDNFVSAKTEVYRITLPPNVGISNENIGVNEVGAISVNWDTPTTFSYYDLAATSVDIRIHIIDDVIEQGPDIVDTMTGGPTWTYTINLYPRHGESVATYTAHYPASVASVSFIFYIDPAGYVYDLSTLERISGATVWLQTPNGVGGWENVPTGQNPAIMQPDENPQITGSSGQYQWDTLPGTYRVHVEAPGYYPADSRVVTVPPPVNDLHVGLTEIPLPEDNSPPEVEAITYSSVPVQVNTPIAFFSSFADSDTHDTHSAFWIWSDGEVSNGVVSEVGGVGSVTGGRAFTKAGVYTETLTLTVIDSNGGTSQSTIDNFYVVVYDPSAGFVTGGGWINSPSGAYSANPALTGKANFGFVSKYEKGTNVPTGNTEFDFKTANINFHSTQYDWLVIGGSKAQFKGTGTLNGQGDYGFMLTAIDGQLKGHGALDTFRIKIWDKTTGNTIYDNQMGAPDNADSSTTIAGGSIIIHTK
jgi:hypothetical protein